MTQTRKKPICHSCGSPMAGHKRPNGTPVCPKPEPISTSQMNLGNPERPSPPAPSHFSETSPPPLSVDPQLTWRKTGYYHYQNPNWNEPDGPSLAYAERPTMRSDSPYTWVSTEPADDIPVKHEGFGELAEIREEDVQIDHDVFISGSQRAASSISSTSSSSASALTRSFTKLLGNSKPLASVFSTPREEVVQLTKTARQYGLFTGIMHRPRPQSQAMKEEYSTSPGTRPRRDSSWWVIFGRDPEVVEHLMEMQDRDTMARFDSSSPGQEETMVGALPARTRFPTRPLFLDLMLAGIFGGVALFVLLSLA